jgi:uncharacterized protein YecE (DUF72 family)
MSAAGRVRVGTCGWSFPDWRGTFYPEGLPAKRWFAFYSDRLDAVEVNNTFYGLPPAATFESWARQAPAGFVYAVKANRALTHGPDPDPPGTLRRLLEGARLLGEHLGPVLYQFPPSLRRDVPFLRSFLALLPGGFRHAVELRHPSWYVEEVRELLAEHGAGFCVHDLRDRASPAWVTAPFAYVRLHGPGPVKYAGRYDPAHLRTWAERVRGFARSGHDVYLFFNNTKNGDGAADAQEMRRRLAEAPVASPAPRRGRAP